MPDTPRLTDRAALLRHRQRGARTGDGGALFLHALARDEIKERLTEVNRTFSAPAVVTGHASEWQSLMPSAQVVSDEPTLALRPEAHDLILHAMALHWADDPVGQLIQCRRALKPDGLMIAVFPGGETLRELRQVLADAEVAVRGGLSPRVAPMGDVRDYGALLQRAGFALPVADHNSVAVEHQSLQALVQDLRAMGETNALAARDRRPMPRAMLEAAHATYSQQFPGDAGLIRTTFDLVYLTGWAPSASQPRPLRPGSARHRLADALGTTEFNTEAEPDNDPRTPSSEDG